MIADAIAEIDEVLSTHAVAADEAHHRRRCAELEIIVERVTRRVAERFGPAVAAMLIGALAECRIELTAAIDSNRVH